MRLWGCELRDCGACAVGVRFSCGIFWGVFVGVGFRVGFGLGFGAWDCGARARDCGEALARELCGVDSCAGFLEAFLSAWVLVRALGLALLGRGLWSADF